MALAMRAGTSLFTTLAALIIAAWATGRVLSDSTALTQWLAWIPTPAALGAATAGVLCALRRPPDPKSPGRPRRAAGWGALLAIMLAYFAFAEHRFHRLAASEQGGLALIHWNASLANDAMARAIIDASSGADELLVVLTDAEGLARTPLFREWSAPYEVIFMGPFAIITSLPVIECGWLVASDDIQAVQLRVSSAGAELSLWMLDLPSEPSRPRMLTARKARRLLESTGAPWPDLIVGDLNVCRASASLRHLAPGYRHAFDLAGSGYGATFGRLLPLYHIDHILAGPRIALRAYEIIDPGAGRHRIQRAWLAL